MHIIEDDLQSVEIRELLRIHAEDMVHSSPEGACHFFDVSQLAADDVTFWSIWDESALAGCGALREIDAHHGEVKSMRTAQEHLGKGVGRQMLSHILEVATSRRYDRISLETGSTPTFDAAIQLYTSMGFERSDPFDAYEPNNFSRFYTLELR